MINTVHEKSLFGTMFKYKYLYLMLIPVILYFVVFRYIPMYGIIIAFQRYSPTIPLFENAWRGLDNFKEFFTSVFAARIIRNTLMINLYGLVFGFPAPIILALMLNEVQKNSFKRIVQTVTYIPHFISMVVTVGIVMSFVSYSGVINEILSRLGIENIQFMTEPGYFYPIYTISDIWQNIGWNSIIYLAAIAGIDNFIYEAAYIDGASRWQQIFKITLPSIYPTISILLILQIGSMMSVGFEKVFLMQNPSIYETADVISTYVYRKGLKELNYSYSAAVGLFNSVVNYILLVGANYLSNKYSESSLW